MAAFLAQVGPAQQTKAKQAATKAAAIPPGDWPLYSRDHTSTRHSPLKQITPANVSKLKEAWTYRPAAPQAAGRNRSL